MICCYECGNEMEAAPTPTSIQVGAGAEWAICRSCGNQDAWYPETGRAASWVGEWYPGETG